MNDSERLTAYGQLRQFESDFDKAQSQLRAIASAWSAAFLGAVALITISGITPIVLPAGAQLVPESMGIDRGAVIVYLRQIVCSVGSAGLYAFWFVDQNVYQRLLHTVFAYGLFLEHANKDLPQIRSSLFIANFDVTSWLGWFYGVQFCAFFLLSALFLFIGTPSVGAHAFILPALHFFGVAVGVVAALRWQSLETIVKNLYPTLTREWPNTEADDAALQAWKARIGVNPLVRNT